MKKHQVYQSVLTGTNEEIGRKMAELPRARDFIMKAPAYFSSAEVTAAKLMYDRYCPGMTAEVTAFAKALGVPFADVAYSWMTYLIPHCSGMIVGKTKTDDGHIRLIRNYEFSIEDEDLMVCHTQVAGRYAHISGSICLFGRTEGINEKGLAVSMTSCGFPVSNLQGMRRPAFTGLQFWAVIRSILENCQNVQEAVTYLNEVPLAYNANILLADRSGNGCLFETMNGAHAEAWLSTAQPTLAATNHIAIKSFQTHEPVAMLNSVQRLALLNEYPASHGKITESGLKQLFTARYPQGMSADYYHDYFGSIKTVVMDCMSGTYDICWFSQPDNGWQHYDFKHEPPAVTAQYYAEAVTDKAFFSLVDLH